MIFTNREIKLFYTVEIFENFHRRKKNNPLEKVETKMEEAVEPFFFDFLQEYKKTIVCNFLNSFQV